MRIVGIHEGDVVVRIRFSELERIQIALWQEQQGQATNDMCEKFVEQAVRELLDTASDETSR